MEVFAMDIADVLVLRPKVFRDERGFFFESYNLRALANVGLKRHFVQDNHSHSRHNVVRGLHYQVRQPQGKLVRVVHGEIFDVAVDLRPDSVTFGRWVKRILSSENKEILWIPPGFAHGFQVLSESADLIYKTTDYYAPQFERTIIWNDPDLKIEWPISQQPVISEKDLRGTQFRNADL